MDFEKLGQFYLGKSFDMEKGEVVEDDFTLLDAKDLRTHGLCLGMTGSGKTGLCIGLLEEAAIDKIPAIIIDPKGDMGNLLLQFPNLAASDFKPWIEESDANAKGVTVDQLAEEKSKAWISGIKKWGQTPDRIKKIQETVDMKIYTPGANHGYSLSLIKALDFPGNETLNDIEAFAELLESTTSRWLYLVTGDLVESDQPEFLLFSEVLKHTWQKEQSLDFVGLIKSIKTPPFSKMGVMDLDSVCSKAKRDKLAMKINALMMSPKFATWFRGTALDVEKLLYGTGGKPQFSIISISHLDEKERMFFVTTLLNEILRWVRKQPGTSSLRALLYMDEIFGYFPPVANPPSKKPMMSLLKQARAQGLGVLLATQNPVDIDYKGLSNIGAWWIGRLNTQRDKDKVLDGLEMASEGGLPRAEYDKIISALPPRVFLMNNVHEKEPALFHTRWALSFLRGPLTTNDIKKLTPKEAQATETPCKTKSVEKTDTVVELPIEWGEPTYLDSGEDDLYSFALFCKTKLHYSKTARQVDSWVEKTVVIPFASDEPCFEDYKTKTKDYLDTTDAKGESFGELPTVSNWKKSLSAWGKQIKSTLYQEESKNLFYFPDAKLASQVDESEEAFRGRIAHTLHELRDEKIEKLRKKIQSRIDTAEKRIDRSEERVEKEKAQYSQQKMSTALGIGATILSAFMGRKVLSSTNVSKAATAMRRAGRTSKEKGDISIAESRLQGDMEALELLKQDLEDDILNLEDAWDPATVELEIMTIKPRKSDIEVSDIEPCWVR